MILTEIKSYVNLEVFLLNQSRNVPFYQS